MEVGRATAVVVSAVGSVLLAASGYAKLKRPLALARVLYALELPSSFRVVFAIGGIECAVAGLGGLALLGDDPTLQRVGFSAVAVTYALFAAFLAWALASDKKLGSCGCVGTADVPPSWVHAAGNGTVALAACVCAVGAPVQPALPTDAGLEAALTFSLVTIAAYLAYLALVRTSGAKNLRSRT